VSGRYICVEEASDFQEGTIVCPECGIGLISVRGEVYRWHFRHEREGCEGGRETALHGFAKQLICDRLSLELPDAMGEMVGASAEVWLTGIRPDVWARYASGEELAVEIWVSHRAEDEKVFAYNEREVAAVEIDLRSLRLAEKGAEEWAEAILHSAPRVWLSPPRGVRARLEAERQARLAQLAADLAAERERRLLEDAHRAEIEASIAAQDRLKRDEELAAYRRELARWDAEYRERKRVLAQEEADRLAAQLARAALEARRKAGLIAEMLAPDLGELVRTHGGYDRITPEAWRDFDERKVRWYDALISGRFYQEPYAEFREKALGLQSGWSVALAQRPPVEDDAL